jgi:Concanavalin A-like lectin/glucanases superfamily
VAYRDEVLADNPILYWRLQEISGTTAADETANNRPGTYVGSPTLGVPGPFNDSFGVALNNASTDHIQRNSEAAFDFERTDAFTMEIWMKWGASSSAIYSPFAKNGGGPAYQGYQLNVNSDSNNVNRLGHISFWLMNTLTGNNQIRVGADDVLDSYHDDRWHHFIATYDGSSQASGVQLYVDAKVLNMTIAINTLTATMKTAAALSIGRADSSFVGQVSEAAIYAGVLPYARIQAHFKANPNEGARPVPVAAF